MSREFATDPFRPSLLDRLLAAQDLGRGQSLDDLEKSICRDLQDLLNTHRPPREQFEGLEYVSRSVANYGMADFSHLDFLSPKRLQVLLDHVKEVIETYEPRLRDVQVVGHSTDEVERIARRDFQHNAVYFQIRARLHGDPAPEVSFETILEVAKGTHTVKKELG